MKIDAARALVVGGSRGLGRLLAIDLAEHGADVAIASHSAPAAANETRAAVEALGRRGAVVVADLTDPAAAAAAVGDAAAALGGLDVLLYVASGPFVPRRPEDVDVTAWEQSHAVIARAFFFAAVAAYRQFLGNAPIALGSGQMGDRGVIVAITDVLGIRPPALFAAHAAAKAAQISLVQSLARAWGPDGVRVCGVAPGPIELPDDPRREATQRAAAHVALRRALQPSEVAAAVRFCLTDDAFSGQNLIVDGGPLVG
jgi:NAD(P)-dependent dehydrogenase (short-subunit alcohol dehydrogenase family)